MSVLIKGLTKEKVESCFRFAKDGWCIFDMPEIIEVPPHGRLVDADAMKTRIEGSDYHTIAVVKQWVDDQPTVIESDGER